MHQPPVKSLALSAQAGAGTRWPDRLAVGVLAVTAAIAAATFRDYGLGWDDYTHSQYGDLLVSLYRSGFTDTRALSFVNLYMYGGGFDLLASLCAKILPFDLFATRRLVGAAVGIVGLFVTWRLGRRLGGPLAGLIAVTLLAACPMYFGHMFINAKDGPFAVTSAIALLGIVRAFEEYPRANPATLALCGIGIGLAVGSRVMGGFAVLDAFLPLPLIVAIRSRALKPKAAFGECGLFLTPFIPAALLAYLVMGLVWPWSVVSPLNPFHAVDYFSNFFEKPWRELFDGRLIPVIDMPRSYVPGLFALKLPELMLALGLCGTAGAFVAAARGGDSGAAAAGRRAALLATALAATLPILITVAAQPAMYNGIRHFVFVLPPFAGLGGLAAASIAQRLRRYGTPAVFAGALALIVGIASPVAAMVQTPPLRIHAFQPHRGRRGRRAAEIHARLLGPVAHPSLTAVALGHCRAARDAAARNLDGRGVRPASAGFGRARPAIHHDLESQRRGFRRDARRVLLRQARRPGVVRGGARRRDLCACLRHPRPVHCHAAHRAGN